MTERAITVAQGLGEPVLESVTWHNLGEAHFWSGNLKTAGSQIERAVAISEQIAAEQFTRSVGVGHDWWAISTCFLSNIDLNLGRPGPVLPVGKRIAERARSMLRSAWSITGRRFVAIHRLIVFFV